jgi:MFS transporter, OFA family, oxalate/formate antiporter
MKRILALVAFYTLFMYGAINSSISTLLPVIINDLEISFKKAGMILTICAISAGFGSMINGYLLSKLKIKKFILLMKIILGAAVLGFSFASSLPLLMFCALFLGFGFSGIFLFSNTVIARTYADKDSKVLSALHLFMGLGSFVMPLLIPLLLLSITWNNVFFVLFLCITAILIYSQKLEYGHIENKDYVEIRKRDIFKKLKDRKTLYYSALAFFYAASDLCIGIWLVTYLNKHIGLDYAVSAHRLSLYYVFLMLGRIIGIFIPSSINKLKLAFWASCIGGICLAFGIAKFHILISFTSLFYAIIFPNIIASAYRDIKEKQDVSMGIVFSFVSFGVAFASFIVGAVSDLAGLQYGFSVSVLMILITSFIICFKNKIIHEQ